MLNASSNIICGPELGIFDREFIYRTSYKTFRRLLLNSALVLENPEVFPYGRLDLLRVCLDGCSLEAKTNFHMGASKHKPNIFSYVESWSKLIEIATVSESYLEFFSYLFLNQDGSKGKGRWAEKSPRNVYYFLEASQLFPKAVMVYVYRNPLDVISSLINRPFARKSLDEACGQFIRSYLGYRRAIQTGKVVVVNYDLLVVNPENELTKLMSAVGEDFKASQLEFYNSKNSVNAGYAVGPVHKKSVFSWENKLTKSDIVYIKKKFEECNLVKLLPI